MYESISSASIDARFPAQASHIGSCKVGGGSLQGLFYNDGWQMLLDQIEQETGKSLDDLDKKVLADSIRIKRLQRKQYFLHEGDLCRFIGLIVKGATKMYSVNERGQESIIAFGTERDWVTDFASFLQSGYSNFFIEAVEETELLLIERNQLLHLLKTIHAFDQMFSRYQDQQLIEYQKRIAASLSMTAEERYFNLLSCKPAYLDRFPQTLLACYIGIQPETLSRIKKERKL